MKANSRLSGTLLAMVVGISLLGQPACAENPVRFKHIPLQYIVALGDPGANSGSGAESARRCQAPSCLLASDSKNAENSI